MASGSGLHAEVRAQLCKLVAAQRAQPGRVKDRRGRILVTGADLSQRFVRDLASWTVYLSSMSHLVTEKT